MSQDGPKLTPLGIFVVLVFIVGSVGAGGYFIYQSLFERKQPTSEKPTTFSSESHKGGSAEASVAEAEIGIAYGTEKKVWLQWAVEEFKNSPEGEKIKVNLIPMGSIEGAKAICEGDARIHVWSPASAAYTDRFRQNWRAKGYTNNPILSEQPLVLSPMVFIMWKDRHASFIKKYGEVTFETIRQAAADPSGSGWAAIGGDPNWGTFKYGHTNPNKSNSGMLALILSAYEFHNKDKALTVGDLVQADFQKWFKQLESNTLQPFPNSTGNMVEEMILKAPASYDVVLAYENLAFDYFDTAKDRTNTGGFEVIYPKKNMWNDNPYYLLDVNWSSEEQRKAAQVFREFLLSPRIQSKAVMNGFRPANIKVSMKSEGSPFVKYADTGLILDLPSMVEAPSSDVIHNLTHSWRQANAN